MKKSTPASALARLKKDYAHGHDVPLAEYALLTLVFNAGVLWVISRPSAAEPGGDAGLPLADIALLGVATHKLARVLSKDVVTTFARAPFTRYERDLGYGEVNETARGTGFPKVVGELLSCNYCMSPWTALALLWGFKRFPRPARRFAGLLSAVTIADLLHVAYEARRTEENVLTLREEQLDRRSAS